eukprot:CAMPEP_0198281834 /NCGR_PEP_ID=MMETSP1449-20131203/1708_1 /TAXON_ID=420275 /ORGANISM="Attheya septentrionalis, Strain CCMP2084" /LENGTH=471 /DNA_ID=CAMNT_0043977783 /DNA_START=124 /DNA_END=1539 /DNA_ORIENTATION=-
MADLEENGNGENGATQPKMIVKHHDLKTTLAGVAGNVMEWYDFAVFGYFADILSKVFFPPDAANALVSSYVVFGAAFVVRPIGAWMIGHIGDTRGRKEALVVSIFLMAVPTFALGCLPTYKSVGGFSTFLLVIVRLLQGLSVGGQYTSSVVFTLEGAPKDKWGLYSSYTVISSSMGVVLGSLVSAIMRYSMSAEDLETYGWRIPFLIGILVSFVGIYLKNHVDVDEEIHQTEPGESSLTKSWRKDNRRAFIAACFIPMVSASAYYITFVWMAVFMESIVNPPVPHAALITFVSAVIAGAMFYPPAGLASDKFGRRPMMMFATIGLIVFSPLILQLVGRSDPWQALFGQTMLGLLISIYNAAMLPFLVEMFPPEVRLTSFSVSYNIALCIWGGLSPALATHLAFKYGDAAPGFLISGVACLSLFGQWLAPKEAYHDTITEYIAGRENTTQAEDLTLAVDESNDVEPDLPAVS